jgi:hypothetical protein
VGTFEAVDVTETKSLPATASTPHAAAAGGATPGARVAAAAAAPVEVTTTKVLASNVAVVEEEKEDGDENDTYVEDAFDEGNQGEEEGKKIAHSLRRKLLSLKVRERLCDPRSPMRHCAYLFSFLLYSPSLRAGT